MTAQILSARPVVDKIKHGLKERCEQLKRSGVTPGMTVVLVGNNPASLSYIKLKGKLCEEVGARFTLVQMPENISAVEFSRQLEKINLDSSVHGLIVQLPVPSQLRHLDLANMVTPEKDIDGFHNENTQALFAGTTDLKLLLPCTPKGIIHLLRDYDVEIESKHVVVIGRSLIVGKPLSMLLSNMNATVTLAHSKTKNLHALTRKADIVIAAFGKGHHLDSSYFDPATKTVVIDVGTNIIGGKLAGDVDFDSVKNVVQAISPVPGGVGPMTVVSLIENLISAAEAGIKKGIK